MSARLRVVADLKEDGLRLDVFVAKATTASRRAARRAIADGAVTVNQRPVRTQSRLLTAGDVVDLVAGDGVAAVDRPELPALEFPFLDRWLAVVDKPAGILSQPAENSDELALDEIVLLTLAEREGKRPFLRLIHRLDRLTSGLIVFARTAEALAPLADAWRSGRVERRYLAIVSGAPDTDTLTLADPIGRDRTHRWRFQVDARGRPARTEVEVMHRGAERSLVACTLSTGRTHQVRVHLAHAGHPVVGDRLYGGDGDAPRPLLHAAFLALPHPRTGRRLDLRAPIPADMALAAPELVAPNAGTIGP